jgi:hypothetical protein
LLSVSNASLGQSASITLEVDGSEQTKTLDLSNVRSAFANDNSAITISAGKVTFNSGTFVVNSTYFSVTSSGVITATSGTIGCMSVGSNSLTVNSGSVSFTSDTFSLSSTYFSVTKSGVITATSGKIGGFSITSGSIYYNRTSHTSLTSGVYLNSDGVSVSDGGRYVALTTGAIKGGRSSGSTTGYIVCDEYFTKNSRYGMRIAGYGGVAIYGDQIGFGSWTSYGSAGTIDVGQSRSFSFGTSVNVGYNGSPSISLGPDIDYDSTYIDDYVYLPTGYYDSDGFFHYTSHRRVYIGTLITSGIDISFNPSITIPGIDATLNKSSITFKKGLMVTS